LESQFQLAKKTENSCLC